jgi:hypothetical protein
MFDGISLLGLTPAGLLLITVLMILTGRLVPKSTHEQTIKERDQWRAAYEVAELARSTQEAQTRELLEVAKTSTAVLTALHEFSEKKQLSQSGDA